MLADQVEQKIRAIIPPDRLASIVDNIGLPISGINISYGNSGTIGVFDADILVTLERRADADRRLCEDACASNCRRRSRARPSRSCPPTSSARSSISARRRRSTCRSPAPISPPAALSPTSCSPRSATSPASPIRASRRRSSTRALKVDFNRELAGVVGLTEEDAATSIQATLSGSTQTAPTYWLNPANGVSYPVSVQTPQYAIDTLGRPQEPAADGGAVDAIAGRARHLLARAARRRSSRTTTSATPSTSMRRRRVATSAASPPTSRRSSTTCARRAAQGLDGRHPRPSRDDGQRLSAVVDRLGASRSC